MTIPSPACLVKDGGGSFVTTAGGVNITPGNVIVIKLASQAGVDRGWYIECATADDLTDAATITASLVIDPLAQTATFTCPLGEGRAYRFLSRVNTGTDVNGIVVDGYETTFGLYTLTALGFRVGADDEGTEGGRSGWGASVNALIRNPAGVSSGEANTGANIGDGADVYEGKLGLALRFRGIKGINGTVVTQNGDNIEVDASGITVSAGDGVRVTGSGGATTVHGVRGTCSLEQFGAVGDSVTDDTAAWQAAAAAILAGTYGTVVLGANRTYLITTGTLVLGAGRSIVGQGPGSIIKTSGDHIVVHINGERAAALNFRIEGDNGTSSQHGVQVGTNGVGMPVRFRVAGVSVEDCYYGFRFIGPSLSNYEGGLVSDCQAVDCNIAYSFTEQAEYVTCVNCHAWGSLAGLRSPGVGFDIGAGNVVVVGGSSSSNIYGSRLLTGTNDAHGIFVGTEFNHNASPILSQAIVYGHTYVACHMYGGEAWLNGGTSIRFYDSHLNFDAGSGLLCNGASAAILKNCTFSTNIGFSIDSTSEVIGLETCRMLDGSIPANAGALVRVSYTFPGDANQTLSRQQAQAQVLAIAAGVVTASRQITNPRLPVKGNQQLVKNGTAQDITYKWNTGTAVTIPAGLSAIVGCDGTNATLELTETTGGGGGGGSPGGANTQFQYNNAGAFAGAAGLVWNAGLGTPVAPAGMSFESAGNYVTLDGAPTASRFLTLPDATDTLVGRATTDTLTNKTVVASLNTITDTSAVSGDILVHNGTRFVRLAKGSNGTFLGVSGGAVGYYTPSGGGGTPGGSVNEVQINASGSFGGATRVTAGTDYLAVGTNAANAGNLRLPNAGTIQFRNFANSANYQALTVDAAGNMQIGDASIGAMTLRCTSASFGTTPADTGTIRLPNSATLYWRNAANTGNYQGLTISGGFLTLGDSQIAQATVAVFSSGTIAFQHGGTNIQQMSSTAITSYKPRHGTSTAPWSSDGSIVVGAGGVSGATGAAFSILEIGVGTTNVTLPAPANASQSYVKFLRCLGTVGVSGATITIGSGATVVMANNTTAVVAVTTAGVFRIGAAGP